MPINRKIPIRLHTSPMTQHFRQDFRTSGLSVLQLSLAATVCLLHVCWAACWAEEWPRTHDSVRLNGGVTLDSVPFESTPETTAAELLDNLSDQSMHGPGPRKLGEFVELAERSHPKLRLALASIEAARGKAVQSRLYPNPLAYAGSPQATAPGSGAQNGGAGSSTQYFTQVSQDIVTAGKLRLSQQAALREVQRAEYELIRARFDVLREVRQSFYALLVSQRRVEIYKLLLGIAKRSYEIGRQLAAAGEGTKADVLFWSIERDRAEVRLLNASVYIETGRRQLATAIGLPRADIGTIDADLLQKLPSFDLKALQEAVVRSNSKPQAAAADIARTQWLLERAVVQPIPNVNLMGGYQREIDYPPANQGLFQVTVAVPLFDRNQGNIRSARAEIATSRAALRVIELDLATQTAQVIAAYRTSQRLVEWYEEYILPKARETVELTQTLYSRGEVTFLSLLQAQRILTETELAFVESQADRWNGAVTIADLLQLETFPLQADAPAVLQSDERGRGDAPNQGVAPPGRLPAAIQPDQIQPLPPP